MPDFVLWALPCPAEQAREQRFATDAKQRGEFAACRVDQFVIAHLETVRITTPSQKAPEQDVSVWRTSRPLGRHPRPCQQRAAFDARHDKSRSLHRVRYLIGAVPER